MLAEAIVMLSADERFVAAWLGGSFGRDQDDALSDVDLTVVVADPHAERLCHRQHQVGAGTTPERLEIFRVAGEPSIVHENHNNAPVGGSFTACVYASGVVIDWILVPATSAARPAATRMLFDTVGVPVQQPAPTLTNAERRHRISEQIAFFWMMVVPTTKLLLRGDLVMFHQLLDMLYRIEDDVERLLVHEPSRYVRWSRAPFLMTASDQRDALVAICDRMEALAPAIIEAGATVPEKRQVAVTPWLDALPHSG